MNRRYRGYSTEGFLVGMVLTTILLIFAGFVLLGCATTTLPENATQAEKNAAMCSDAIKGLAVGQVGVSMSTSQEQVKYWQRWLDGARKSIAVYCME